MADQTFSNGCISLRKTDSADGIKIENISTSLVTAEKANPKDPDGDPDDPAKNLITVKVTIEATITGVAFFPAKTVFKDAIWQKMKDKVIWGFVPGKVGVLSKLDNFKFLNFDDGKDNIIGNQVTFDFDDAKIGGAG